jgi:hypothetical protein
MMTKSLFGAIVALLVLVDVGAAQDQIAGKWTYRSYHNRPEVMVGDDAEPAEKALSLIFGEGVVTLEVGADGTARGALELGENYALDLAGTVKPGTPVTVELTGTGRAGTPTAGWEYRYHGFLAPTWDGGVRQVPALVGTVLRSKAHGGSQPGYTTSFIATKRPQPAP